MTPSGQKMALKIGNFEFLACFGHRSCYTWWNNSRFPFFNASGYLLLYFARKNAKKHFLPSGPAISNSEFLQFIEISIFNPSKISHNPSDGAEIVVEYTRLSKEEVVGN